MIGSFEKSIIDSLNKNNLHTKKYFGELIDPRNFQFKEGDLPLILIDYLGDEPETNFTNKYSFNLYVAHISYSNNEKTRGLKHQEIYELLNQVNNNLDQKSFDGSNPIQIGKSEKIFDSMAKQGYLTVYLKKFTVILKKEIYE